MLESNIEIKIKNSIVIKEIENDEYSHEKLIPILLLRTNRLNKHIQIKKG